MLVIAHRGARQGFAENTLPAFERAIELGADFVEFDVWQGGVVTHDRPVQGTRYPTLAEVVAVCRGRIGMMVEVKRPRGDDVVRTLELLEDEDVLVSFNRPALVQSRALRPRIRTVQHVGFGVSIRGAEGAWAAGFKDARVTRRGLAAARALGLVPLVYTVNEPARMRELADAGVAGIFTDRLELALPLFPAAARR